MSDPHRLHPAAIVLMGLQIVRQFAIPALIPIVIIFGYLFLVRRTGALDNL